MYRNGRPTTETTRADANMSLDGARVASHLALVVVRPTVAGADRSNHRVAVLVAADTLGRVLAALAGRQATDFVVTTRHRLTRIITYTHIIINRSSSSFLLFVIINVSSPSVYMFTRLFFSAENVSF